MKKQNIIIIGGPTSSGKSAYAIDVASRINGAVVNVDSMQLYRETPIITAQPSSAQQAIVPHYLYGIFPASFHCSVSAWQEKATETIVALGREERIPIIVGGTGMYIRALMHGMAAIPDIPDAVRQEIRQQHATIGAEEFHALLTDKDPVMAERLATKDTQRIIRAMEVIVHTGKSLDYWQNQPTVPPFPEASFHVFTCMPERDKLYARCNQRVHDMIESGALDEIRSLKAQKLDPSLPAMKALGVRELCSHLDNEITLEEAIAATQQATRRYAKRQYTWFRHQMADATVVTSADDIISSVNNS